MKIQANSNEKEIKVKNIDKMVLDNDELLETFENYVDMDGGEPFPTQQKTPEILKSIVHSETQKEKGKYSSIEKKMA